MSAFESVFKSVKQWQPKPLPTELKYRDSLIGHLREQLKGATIEPEYRHCGTTADIYVKEKGFLGSSEVFVEMKRNLTSKSQLDRLVGQIESLQPREHFIIVVLCGESNPTLLSRLKERYEAGQQYRVLIDPCLEVVVKQDGRNA